MPTPRPRKTATDTALTSPSTEQRLFAGYSPLATAYDEFFASATAPREQVASAVELLDRLGPEEFRRRQTLADVAFRQAGVTFSVYSDSQGVEKIFPFDLIPRTVSAREWSKIDAGLIQRVTALNAFLNDIYGDQKILADGKIPRAMVEGSTGYLPKMRGIRPKDGVRVQISGIDLVRRPDGEFVVLEDNIRTPSGVSYVLENRDVMKRVFPRIFERSRVRPVNAYPLRLRDSLISLSPRSPEETRLVVLTPGPFNSAYFEHSFLARRMGVDLVQAQDLFVHDDIVYVKTTRGPERVDVVYRRIDDEFVDPEAFRPDSMLGVPGLVRCYAKGTVTLANAIGNGVADDKAIYPYVPDMIRFYLGAEPILQQVPTYICAKPADLTYTLEHLGEMVVKAVDASGGYGMLFGPRSTKEQIADFAVKLKASPRGYIAQPVVELSTCPTWTGTGIAPRRVDLRPYIVSGRTTWVLPGGLTRVALVEGSYVVNSSQGGGSKDTWVLEETNRG